MRPTTFLSASLALALLACASEQTPTQPDASGDPAPAAPSLAAAPNSWTPTAPPPFSEHIFGFALGMAPNSAGQSIVYAFGATSDEDGGSGGLVSAYNAATDTWSFRSAETSIFDPNGVGKIGNKLYFSGGYDYHSGSAVATNQVWAYDYSHDRMIRKADLPIHSAEGVTGVIDGKLYVLPGVCSGERWPFPGYCENEFNRRFYRYDPATNTWKTRAWSPHVHIGGAAGVIGGKLYVAGGQGVGFQPGAYLDVYDPANNTWRTLAPMPTADPFVSGAALQGKLYVVAHGFSGASIPARTYAYDPVTNRWKAKAPEIGGEVTRVTLDGKSYLFAVAGGHSELYTP